MDRIDQDKIKELVQTLATRNRDANYAVGWMMSMMKLLDSSLGLNKRQIKAFNRMIEDNIRWASGKQ